MGDPHKATSPAHKPPGPPKLIPDAKDADAFFNDLAASDRAIANRWRNVTHNGAIHGLLGGDLIAKIIDQSILDANKRGDMTDGEAAAIMKLVKSKQLDDLGIEEARTMLKLAEEYGLSQGISATPVKKDDLSPVFDAINAKTKDINFVSPGTGIHYMPAHYQTIKSFIVDGKIGVFWVNKDAEFRTFANTGAVEKVGGLYRSNKNTLFLGSGHSANESAHLVVHEVTHAIQDWQDVNTTNKFAEADAFVAGAVADASANAVSPPGRPQDQARLAVAYVLNKKALNRNDKDWSKAYAALVSVVETDDAYKVQANVRFRSQQPGENGRERKVFAKTLADIEKLDSAVNTIMSDPDAATKALGKIFAPASPAPAPSHR